MHETSPVADLALQLLHTSPAGLELPASAKARLVATLADIDDRAALLDAMRALVSLAHHLDRHGGRAAAKTLLEVASTGLPALEESSTPKTLDRLHDRARSFARFDDRAPARAPPAVFTFTRESSPFRRLPARLR